MPERREADAANNVLRSANVWRRAERTGRAIREGAWTGSGGEDFNL